MLAAAKYIGAGLLLRFNWTGAGNWFNFLFINCSTARNPQIRSIIQFLQFLGFALAESYVISFSLMH